MCFFFFPFSAAPIRSISSINIADKGGVVLPPPDYLGSLQTGTTSDMRVDSSKGTTVARPESTTPVSKMALHLINYMGPTVLFHPYHLSGHLTELLTGSLYCLLLFTLEHHVCTCLISQQTLFVRAGCSKHSSFSAPC